jgi:hypothetical protein
VTEVPVIPADPDGLDFRFRVGTSILTEFAVSHTPADVRRRLARADELPHIIPFPEPETSYLNTPAKTSKALASRRKPPPSRGLREL